MPAALRTRCAACGRTLSLHERFSGGFCNDWQCRRRSTDEALRELRRALERQAAEEREIEAVRRGDAELRSVPTVVVRWFEAPLEPVPESQRRALRDHLSSLQAEVDALLEAADERSEGAAPRPAEADPAAADLQAEADAAADIETPRQTPEPAAVDALLGQVCARCTGYCCQPGHGGHAFLDAPALLRARLARPEARHGEIVDDYLAAVADRHFAGSCAYHGVQGCTLPRASRAEVCNAYRCDGLVEARAQAEDAGVQRVYVVRHGPGRAAVGAFAPPLPVEPSKG